MDEWLKFIGMYISDENVHNNVTYINCLKDRKVKYCEDFLSKLKLNYTYSSDKFKISSSDIYNHCKFR